MIPEEFEEFHDDEEVDETFADRPLLREDEPTSAPLYRLDEDRLAESDHHFQHTLFGCFESWDHCESQVFKFVS